MQIRDFLTSPSSFGRDHSELDISRKDDGDAFSKMDLYFTLESCQLRPHVNANLLLGRDLNCSRKNIDKIGGKDVRSRKNAIQSMVKMCNNLNLVDIWRLQHPNDARFTWQNSSGKIRCR